MPSATISVNDDVCIDFWSYVYEDNSTKSMPKFYCVCTFPYEQLFCAFSSVRTCTLELIVRAVTPVAPATDKSTSNCKSKHDNNVLIHCEKIGVYHGSEHNKYFGRVFWDVGSMLNGHDYGPLEYCLFLTS